MVIGLATGAVLAGLGTVAWALAGVGEFLAFFGLWGGLTAGVALVLARLLRRRPDGGDDDGPGGGGGPGGPPPDDGPPWWPEFERALHEYSQTDVRPC